MRKLSKEQQTGPDSSQERKLQRLVHTNETQPLGIRESGFKIRHHFLSFTLTNIKREKVQKETEETGPLVYRQWRCLLVQAKIRKHFNEHQRETGVFVQRVYGAVFKKNDGTIRVLYVFLSFG